MTTTGHARITPFPPGTLLRVTEDHQLPGSAPVRTGQELTVDMYVPGAASDDGVAYYYGDDKEWTTLYVDPAKVELVKSAEDLTARRIPTAEEIIAELHCMDDYEGFRITEAERPDGNSREIAGVTEDGLFFACTITVSNVYQGDF